MISTLVFTLAFSKKFEYSLPFSLSHSVREQSGLELFNFIRRIHSVENQSVRQIIKMQCFLIS